MPKDLYETLGIAKGATDQEIKNAYRKQALKYHPDKHKGDKDSEEKFKEINQAYETLSDKSKRQQYDTFGSTGGGGGGHGGGGYSGGGQGFGGFDFGGDQGGFADIFETFFGAQGGSGKSRSSRKSGGAMRGNDIEANIRISFEDAVFGCEKDLEISKQDQCGHCKGNGAEPGTPIVTCKQCHGSGEIRTIRNTILGQMSTQHVCDECNGSGRMAEKKCTTCHGSTRVRMKDRVKVKIPAGVDNGSTIRVTGKGEGGARGGASGDLYINLAVEASKKFVRDGMDIHSEVEVALVQAVLGSEIDVDTLDGVQTIRIPAGTQDGKVFKLSEKGVVRIGGTVRGNHLVKIKVVVPEKLSKRERELYIELAKESGIDVKKGGWW